MDLHGRSLLKVTDLSAEEFRLSLGEPEVGQQLYAKRGLDALGVTDEAFESPASVVFGQAENRMQLNDGDRRLIAKLSARSDPYPVVKAEAVAMELARRVGLEVAPTEVTEVLGHDVLLVDRFDRPGGGRQRRMLVSALTILGLDVMMARYATYYDLADAIRNRFTEPRQSLRELFSRITFNICVSNTDDHATIRAEWDEAADVARLTPVERDRLWGRQILNPYALQDAA